MHRARKRFGQNFLMDQGVITAIVNALNPTPACTFWKLVQDWAP